MHACRRSASTVVRTLSTSASTSAGSSYNPPLKSGVLPAYDHALEYIAQDRKQKLEQLEKLQRDQSGTNKEQLEKLEVEAWANDPETRWRAKTGNGDLSKPVFRHLAERRWRKEGDLAILMQRVTQMNITPDLLPSIDPEADVRYSINGETLVPGVFTLPSATRDPVKVTAQVFHPEEKLYTLLMIDPDVPDEANHAFTTFAHMLVPNIPLSSTESTISASATLPYVPPHPQQGTPYHRYTFLLFAQPGQLELVSEAIEREDFNVRAFMQEHGLEAKGVTFFRQKWDKTVSEIYRDVLGKEEPRYGRPPKMDTYAGRPAKYELV